MPRCQRVTLQRWRESERGRAAAERAGCVGQGGGRQGGGAEVRDAWVELGCKAGSLEGFEGRPPPERPRLAVTHAARRAPWCVHPQSARQDCGCTSCRPPGVPQTGMAAAAPCSSLLTGLLSCPPTTPAAGRSRCCGRRPRTGCRCCSTPMWPRRRCSGDRWSVQWRRMRACASPPPLPSSSGRPSPSSSRRALVLQETLKKSACLVAGAA